MRKISNMARKAKNWLTTMSRKNWDKDLRRTLNYYELLAANCEIGILDQVSH